MTFPDVDKGVVIVAGAGGIGGGIKVGKFETFNVERNDDRTISFKTDEGKYLTCLPEGDIKWDAEEANSWEKFKVELTWNGFRLRTCHDNCLSCNPEGEPTTMEGSFPVVFKSAHGFYLCALEEGVLEWSREEVGEWEVFECEMKDGKATFKSAHGQYLCADGEGLVCDRDEPGEWETFEIVEGLDGNGFALKTAHGTYVCADGETAVADREEVGEWETINA